MRILKVLFIVLLMNFKSLAQTNYYVSPIGNDSNNGTSIATAWQTIQKAANTATPNSIVTILAGTYNELITINVNGTTGNPITFKNYQNDVVIVSGTGITASYSNLIVLNNKSNIVIDGLILENLTCPFARGILVLSNTGNPVENISFKNLKIRNIGFTSNPSSMPIAGDNAHGIEVYGTGTATTDAIMNVLIENCEVYNNILGYSEAVTINGNVDGFSILNNSIHDNTNIGIDVAGNFGASTNATLDHARNGLIAGNIVYNNISPVANSSGIYCDGCQTTVIEKNASHHNTVGITVGCEQNGSTDNVIVRNNMIYNNTFTGIEIGGYTTATTGIVTNSIIKNNTCFHNDSSETHGELVINKVNNCQIVNNAFHTQNNLFFYVDNIDPQNYTSNYNSFSTSSDATVISQVNYRWNTIDFSDYVTSTGKDVNSISPGSSQFIDQFGTIPDLHLQSFSPLINAGNPSLFTILETDFDGDLRTNGITDIGADEFYSLNIDQNKAETNFSLYPNPSSNFITIENKNQEIQDVQIYNALGQLVQEVVISNSSKIDISNLSNGLYFVKLKNQLHESFKFVKN